jgi:hypothetical protein
MVPALLLVLSCVAGDLAVGKPVSGATLAGDPALITSPGAIVDGTPWDSPQAVRLGAKQALTIDLGEPRPVGAVWLQADDDDAYLVEGSPDGEHYTVLWSAPPSERGHGLRTRMRVLDAPVDTRTLRVSGRGGDGHYAIGRLRVFCARPEMWPGEPPWWSPVSWWRAIDNDRMVALKGGLAAAGALLLLAGAILSWRGRAQVLRRSRDALLAVLGLAAGAAWWNFGHLHFDDYLHYWDIYHYYIGAKYFPELGYDGMYACSVVAEAELYGKDGLANRTISDLVTNQLVPVGPILADPARCTARFTPERWAAFKGDVAYFRSEISPGRWVEVLHDHGYNGTPVWGVVGRVLTNLGPATRPQAFALALLDPALLILMWIGIAWAFGWRVACVGLLFWGTNFPARYYWNGGAFLRMDWLALAMLGIACARRDRPASAGFLLGWSALLRVFPGFILVGLLLKWGVASVRARRLVLTPAARRFLVGALAAGALLLPIGLLGVGRPPGETLVGFVENSRKHLDTPLTNNMGWKTVVAYDAPTRARVAVGGGIDPWGPWKDARRRFFAERRWIFLVGVAAFLGLLGWAVVPLSDWEALALGIGLIPIATELTCYYYAFLLGFAFLWPRRPLVGVGLLVTAAASCVAYRMGTWEDARFYNCSLQVLIFVVAATWLVGRRQPMGQPVGSADSSAQRA